MIILPLMTCAIISSLGSALLDGGGARLLKRSAAIFLCSMLAGAVAALVCGIIIQPGVGLSPDAQRALGAAMLEGDAKQGGAPPGLWSFVISLFPTNVAEAASKGEMLGVMSFVVLVGIALGLLKDGVGRPVIVGADIILQASLKIMHWILKFLPLGIFSLISVNFAKLGINTISLALKLLITYYISLAAMFVIMIVLGVLKTKKSPMSVLKIIKDPLVLGFGTQSDFAPLALAIDSARNMGANKSTADLVVPLGINLSNVGYVMYFVIACLFVAQLYGKAISIEIGAIIIVGSILVTIAGGEVAMLAIALGPIGLPAEAAMAVLAPIGPLIQPVLVPINILGNILAAVYADVPVSSSSVSATESLKAV